MALGTTLRHLTRKTDLLVTPRVREFLMRNPEGMLLNDDGSDLADETKELVLEIMQKSFVGNSDRSGRFGASGRGTCQRKQMWTFLGMPSRKLMEPETLNLFNDGKYRHLRWQVMGIQSGALTHIEYPLSYRKYRLTSSVDGLNSYEQFIWELKGDRYMARLLDGADAPDSVVSKHMLQVHTMFLMTGWEKASYVMEDKATNDFRERVVYRDPALIHVVVKELEELNQHVEDRTLPEPLAACQAKEGPYRTCPYARPCIERWQQGNGYWPDEPGNWES
jgi:hypothetical protein